MVNSICGNEDFFNLTSLLYSTKPNFSHCFEQMVLNLVPCLYFFIFGFPIYLKRKKLYFSCIPTSSLYNFRMIFTVLIAISSFANILITLYEYNHANPAPLAYFISPSILCITMILVMKFLELERIKGVMTSGFLTFFWATCLLMFSFQLISKLTVIIENDVLSEKDSLYAAAFLVSYSGVLANFILCFFVDGPRAEINEDPYLRKEEQNDFIIKNSKDKPLLSPEESACFLSQLTKHWFNGLVWYGYKKSLTVKDLWSLDDDNKSSKNVRRFIESWKKELKKFQGDQGCVNEGYQQSLEDNENADEMPLLDDLQLNYLPSSSKKPSLLRALIKTFFSDFALTILLQFLMLLFFIFEPQLLKGLINFAVSDLPAWYGFSLAVLLFGNSCLMDTAEQEFQFVCQKVGMRIRAAIISAVYRKALVLSNTSRKSSTSGEIVNLMSIDAQRISDVVHWLNLLWAGPVQAALALTMLYQQLGISSLSGVGFLVLMVPFNLIFFRKLFNYNTDRMKIKDERIKMMNEVLHGIKLLKMYAWELSFKEKVEHIRNLELGKLRNCFNIRIFLRVAFMVTPTCVSVLTFGVYIASDSTHVLNAEKAFVSLTLFNLLFWPLHLLPIVVPILIDAKVSMKRLNDFLCLDELKASDVIKSRGLYEEGCNEDEDQSCDVISIKNGKFLWNKDDKPTLENINFNVEKGQLVAIVGQVGTGKSSLLSAVLGDMEKVEGQVRVYGSTAYVPQQAWIQNATAQNNILFGKDLNKSFYDNTVEICQLTEDFTMLPAGDQTEIGERGINLSGGQKQRLSLARAVYQDTEVYLFDDPLSAVDAHVGKNIFDLVLGPNGVLKDKTRVLVTHGVSFLPQMDKIVVLTDGKISETGTYESLLASNKAFSEFLNTHAEGQQKDGKTEEEEGGTDNQLRNRSKSNKNDEENKKKTNTNDKMMTEETAETGKVDKKNYLVYLKSFGFTLAALSFLAESSYQMLDSISALWLSAWTNDPSDPVTGVQNSTTYRLLVYGSFGIGQGLASLVGTMVVFHGAIVGGRIIHNNMLLRILRSPMSFFDTTPLGRILNRFSKDVGVVDEAVPIIMREMVTHCASMVCIIIGISYTTYKFLFFLIPISIVYFFIQHIFIPTSRQIRRLESISRSPVYSHFEETLLGVSTIRAFNMKEHFSHQNEEKIDEMTKVVYCRVVAFRWLALRLTVVGSLIVLASAILSVLEQGTIQAGLVGLSITFSLSTTGRMNAIVRLLIEIENHAVAIERVEEYCVIEEEAPLHVENSVNEEWPADGQIVFDEYATKYRSELDLVVQDVSLKINGGEKIGVVGRTGAGKSSLTLALFRIIEPSQGRIYIDDKDTTKMGLHDLRSKLAIIPQDPILFSGSLRMNLDPFEVYTDEKLWEALEHSHLKTFVASTSKKLEHEVSEGGENLSVGQRQLVCLARALLKKSKILVLDEATAAVDLETDSLIQATIREQFTSCTVFTIAHRLNTIMDSDRIAVMDAGRLVQLGTPEDLMKDQEGIFYSMAKNAGLTS